MNMFIPGRILFINDLAGGTLKILNWIKSYLKFSRKVKLNPYLIDPVQV